MASKLRRSGTLRCAYEGRQAFLPGETDSYALRIDGI